MKLQVLLFCFISAVTCIDLHTYTGNNFRIYHRDALTVMACQFIIGKQAFYFGEEDPIGFCDIGNQPALGSMVHCLTQTNSTKAIGVFLADCEPKTGLTKADFDFAYKNATKYLVANATADPEFNATEPYSKPVVIGDAKLIAAIESTCNRWTNYNYGNIFGLVLIAYWFLMIILSGVWNLLKFATPKFIQSFTGGFVNKIRKFITMPATFGQKHSDYAYLFKVWPVLIPTRLETLMIGGWLVLVLAFNVTNYEHQEPNVIWPLKPTEMGRKIADRTGMECLMLFPTLILFTGRNNFLQLITGWSYSRFILIHKWVARITTLLAMIHGVGMTYNGKGLGKYETRNAEAYVRWGYVGFISMVILCVQGLSALRKNSYEVFIAVHVIFAVFAVVGGYMHVAEQHYEDFYRCAYVVWAFDRFVRYVRVGFFGIRTATVELKADETVKVTVKRPAYWKPFPGAHAFVYFFRPTMFWQSHPFTIVDEVVEENTINFYIKIKGGMSHGLMRYLSNQPGQKASIKIGVEGPYGKRLPLSRYDDSLFISSGNGIPGLYSEAMDLATKKESHRIKFVWIIRHYKSIEWFFTELGNLQNKNIDVQIYVTNGSESVKPFWNETETDLESDGDKNEKTVEKSQDVIEALTSKLSHVTFIQGRPNIDEMVSQSITESSGSIAVATCCHASIDDDVRKAVANNLDKSKNRVDLFDQIQIW